MKKIVVLLVLVLSWNTYVFSKTIPTEKQRLDMVMILMSDYHGRGLFHSQAYLYMNKEYGWSKRTIDDYFHHTPLNKFNSEYLIGIYGDWYCFCNNEDYFYRYFNEYRPVLTNFTALYNILVKIGKEHASKIKKELSSEMMLAPAVCTETYLSCYEPDGNRILTSIRNLPNFMLKECSGEDCPCEDITVYVSTNKIYHHISGSCDSDANSLMIYDYNSTDEYEKDLDKWMKEANVKTFENIYFHVEVPPQFPGGMVELMKWVKSNLRYPKSAQGISGQVKIRFVINEFGDIESRMEILSSLTPDCDKEAVALCRRMPKWQAGEKNGVKVKVYYTLSITFDRNGYEEYFKNKENNKSSKKLKVKDNNGTPQIVNSSTNDNYTADKKLLTEDDLYELSKQELSILRNEIFARHGYIFKSKDLQEYFLKQSWYHPQYTDVSNKLNSIERQNIALIKKYETEFFSK